MRNVLVIGGGAAGMMAAIAAAEAGAAVTLLERNKKPGKKLYITGAATPQTTAPWRSSCARCPATPAFSTAP